LGGVNSLLWLSERGEEPVAHRFHRASAAEFDLAAQELEMVGQQALPRLVVQPGRELRRADDVGEHDGPERVAGSRSARPGEELLDLADQHLRIAQPGHGVLAGDGCGSRVRDRGGGRPTALPLAAVSMRTRAETSSGWAAANSAEVRAASPPPTSAGRVTPHASITAARSPMYWASEGGRLAESDAPVPRRSKIATRANLP